MITINSIGGAGAAAAYYAKDNYYTREEGLRDSEWFGEGAKRLGLVTHDMRGEQSTHEQRAGAKDNRTIQEQGGGHGLEQEPEQGELLTDPKTDRNLDQAAAKEAKLKDILQGRFEGQRIGSAAKDGEWKHDAGKDIGFSVHKSVTVMALVAGDVRVQKAMRSAMYETMSLAERHLPMVRDRSGGETKYHRTGNMTGFVAFHTTNRNGSPDMHVHFVMANATHDSRDGKWKSMWMRPFYENRYALERVFNGALMRNLDRLGYDIGTDKRGFAYIRDVPVDVSREFSDRRPELMAQVGQSNSWMSRNLAALSTRNRKVAAIAKELIAGWTGRAQAKGFDYEGAVERSKARAATRVQSGVLTNQIDKAIRRASRELTETSVTTDRLRIIGEASNILDGGADTSRIDARVTAAASETNLVFHSTSFGGSERITTSAMLSVEREIAEFVQEGKDVAPLIARKDTVRSRLEATTLNKGQIEAAATILTSPGRFVGLQAAAGTGKTYTIARALNILQEGRQSEAVAVADTIRRALGPNDRTAVFGIAPSHAAVRELHNSIGGERMTVQRMVKMGAKAMSDGKMPPALEAMRGSIVVLDEASMMGYKDTRILAEMANALELQKLVIIGDEKQLESPQAGPAWTLIQDTGYLDIASMDIIMRQKDGTELKVAVEALYEGDQKSFFKALERHTTETDAYVTAAAKGYASDVREKGTYTETLAIAFDNRTKRALNAEIRSTLQEQGMLASGETRVPTLNPIRNEAALRGNAESYSRNDHLAFHRSIRGRLNIKAGSLWKVIDTDGRANTITVRSTDKRDRKARVIALDQLPKDAAMSHLGTGEMAISTGDRVKIRMRSETYGINNSDTLTIQGVKPSSIRVKTDTGRLFNLPRNSLEAHTLELAYVQTASQSQGQTVNSVHIAANPHTRAASEAAILVAASRAREDANIYTDSVARLKSRIFENSGHDVLAKQAEGLDAPVDLAREIYDKTPEAIDLKVHEGETADRNVEAIDHQKEGEQKRGEMESPDGADVRLEVDKAWNDSVATGKPENQKVAKSEARQNNGVSHPTSDKGERDYDRDFGR